MPADVKHNHQIADFPVVGEATASFFQGDRWDVAIYPWFPNLGATTQQVAGLAQPGLPAFGSAATARWPEVLRLLQGQKVDAVTWQRWWREGSENMGCRPDLG